MNENTGEVNLGDHVKNLPNTPTKNVTGQWAEDFSEKQEKYKAALPRIPSSTTSVKDIFPGKPPRYKQRIKFRHFLQYAVLAAVLTGTITSVLLLLLGTLMSSRSCLTAGCILGLSCLGIFLHNCLRYRTFPSEPKMMMFSAAYMYPVCNLQLGVNPETAAAATAVATAALLPSHRLTPTGPLASSLEIAMLGQLRTQISKESQASCFGPQSLDQRYKNCPRSVGGDIDGSSASYFRQVSDSAVYSNSRRYATDVHNTRTVTSLTLENPNEIVNRPGEDEWLSPDFKIDSRMQEKNTGVMDPCPEVVLRKTSFTRDTQQHKRISVPEPETDDPQVKITHESCPLPSPAWSSNGSSADPEDGDLGNIRPHSEIVKSNETKIRLIPPMELTERKHSPIVPFAPEIRKDISNEFVNLFTNRSSCEHVTRFDRRNTREMDGLFGPRVWRPWRSWVDP